MVLLIRLLGSVLRSMGLLIGLLVLRLGAILRSLGLLRSILRSLGLLGLLGNVRIFHCKRYLVLIIC